MNIYIAEFIGTGLLLLMGAGVVANVVLKQTKGNNSGWIVITTAWALGVFIGVVVAGPYSGAHLNPAVSVGLAVAGLFEWSLVPGYVLAQILGAGAGSSLAWLIYKDHFDLTDDPNLKFAPFATAPAIRNLSSNFLSEVVGTFVLILVILYSTGANLEDPNNTPIGLGALGALPVALLVWVIGLALGGTTGYAINPARDLGPRLAHQFLPIKGKGSSDWAYSWVPIVGPLMGASLAAATFLILGS
ncbi:MIP/aquaporin family protein [Echinicola vietnamensis]|uniref:Permease, glycerol uptake facilitator n=1 Tax=Echinicola vietnamensis (strain DSM 17526 / LMG 23754 / KMM 6221) TaxID=926556 RepID=L0FVY5_ECHVK|nr:MIP/aquaporin family protein [Echinicola vietnamensis]AGA78034.1 permease, glycerol uptake facilitator [Echinicola vietnamensis DSM 17526]